MTISHFGDSETRIKEATRVLRAQADYSQAFNTVAERLFAYSYSRPSCAS